MPDLSRYLGRGARREPGEGGVTLRRDDDTISVNRGEAGTVEVWWRGMRLTIENEHDVIAAPVLRVEHVR